MELGLGPTRLLYLIQHYNALSSFIPCRKPKKVNFQSQTPRNVLKFSADGQHVLSNNGAFIVDNIYKECKENEVTDESLNYLYLDNSGWICNGRQAFIKLPRLIEPFCQDVRGKKIVIGFGNRPLLVLDIDTRTLDAMLRSAISIHGSTNTPVSSLYYSTTSFEI